MTTSGRSAQQSGREAHSIPAAAHFVDQWCCGFDAVMHVDEHDARWVVGLCDVTTSPTRWRQFG